MWTDRIHGAARASPTEARTVTASVVICAYTEARWPLLAAASRGALAQAPAPLEVLVVVDHDAALLARCRSELPGGVRVLPSEGGAGLSGARNTGVRHAEGDVVVFLDDDASPDARWLIEMLAPYADPAVQGVGGRSLPRWGGPRPGWIPDEFLWTVGCSHRGLPVRTAPVRNPIGATMSFRREALAGVGGFREELGRRGEDPLGCEETELAIRVLRAHPGGTILYVPTALVEHAVPPERATWRYFRRRCFGEGRSKALVADRVGTADALTVELRYVTRTLPTGVLRGLRDAASGRPAGLAQACAIVAGLAVTAAGFARGTAERRLRDEP